MAVGGSTNAVLHLLALAAEAGVPLDIFDFNEFYRSTPTLCDMKPGGRYVMNDLFHRRRRSEGHAAPPGRTPSPRGLHDGERQDGQGKPGGRLHRPRRPGCHSPILRPRGPARANQHSARQPRGGRRRVENRRNRGVRPSRARARVRERRGRPGGNTKEGHPQGGHGGDPQRRPPGQPRGCGRCWPPPRRLPEQGCLPM